MNNENDGNYEGEMGVPTEQKLQAMVTLFENAMTETEQRLFLLYMIAQAIETFGPEDLKDKIEVMLADGIGDCPDNCPLCNPDKGHMSEDAMLRLWEEIAKRKIEDGDDDGDWSEVIH